MISPLLKTFVFTGQMNSPEFEKSHFDFCAQSPPLRHVCSSVYRTNPDPVLVCPSQQPPFLRLWEPTELPAAPMLRRASLFDYYPRIVKRGFSIPTPWSIPSILQTLRPPLSPIRTLIPWEQLFPGTRVELRTKSCETLKEIARCTPKISDHVY
jgi:hypothetical protein